MGVLLSAAKGPHAEWQALQSMNVRNPAKACFFGLWGRGGNERFPKKPTVVNLNVAGRVLPGQGVSTPPRRFPSVFLLAVSKREYAIFTISRRAKSLHESISLLSLFKGFSNALVLNTRWGIKDRQECPKKQFFACQKDKARSIQKTFLAFVDGACANVGIISLNEDDWNAKCRFIQSRSAKDYLFQNKNDWIGISSMSA